MKYLNSKGYRIDEVSIVPAEISLINSRSECVPFDDDGNYPIFCAPMSAVTDEKNYDIWKQNKLIPILPRTVNYEKRIEILNEGEWVAFGLSEFKHLFIDTADSLAKGKTYKVCIDMANGHMKSIYDSVNMAKTLAKDNGYVLIIMTGNIANPETYKWIANNSNVDYVRINIGTGKVCITSKETGVHFSSGTLLQMCADIKSYMNGINCPKIVCDGGIHSYADINVALAMGADYVMLGSMLAALDESAAYKTENGECLYYGMSTEIAQKHIDMASETAKDSKFNYKVEEGIAIHIKRNGSVISWIRKFDAYLRSAMSYTNCKTLKAFTSGDVVTMVK